MSTEGLRVISGVWASGVDEYTAFSAACNQDRIDHNQDQPIQRNQICVRRMGLENHDPKPTLLPGDRGHHRLIYTFSYHSIVLFLGNNESEHEAIRYRHHSQLEVDQTLLWAWTLFLARDRRADRASYT